MKLLTIGIGRKGSEVSSLLAKKGVKVNRIPLFRCYAVTNSLDDLKAIKLGQKNKFWLMARDGRIDVRSVLNEMLSRYELHEGSLIITSLDDEFGVDTAVEFGKNLMRFSDDPVIGLGIVPPFERVDPNDLRRRIRKFREAVRVLMLVEEEMIGQNLVEALNVIARVGEIDLKKRIAGEVVIDTSDVFNALMFEGFSAIGFAKRRLPVTWFYKVLLRKDSEVIAVRTQRMVEMVEEALQNLSVKGDVETAKSALIVFAGNPNEITMDGMFSCIEMVEKLNENMVVRYGDYPIPRSQSVSVVLLLSGITRFRI